MAYVRFPLQVRPLLRTLVPALLLFLALGLATPAQAQGTSGQVPDPMSSIELSRLLSLYVHPDKTQEEAIERLHDDYRARFRALREGDIQKLLDKMSGFDGAMPTKQQVDDMLRNMERINKQVGDVDDAFFDGLDALMGPERAQGVRRARDARTRARMVSGMANGMIFGGYFADLSTLVLQLELPPEQLAPLAPTLIAYEQRLTTLYRDMMQATLRMYRDMFEEMEKSGVLEQMDAESLQADPERMQEVMEAFQAAMAKVMTKVQAKGKEMSEFNTQSLRSLLDQLSGEPRRKLRVRYMSQTMPEYLGSTLDTERLFRMALRIAALDDGTRAQVREAYERWQAEDDTLIDQMLKIYDNMRASMSPMDVTRQEAAQEAAQRLHDLTAKREERGSAALRSIQGVLGDERFNKLVDKRSRSPVTDIFAEQGDPEAEEAQAGAIPGMREGMSLNDVEMMAHRHVMSTRPMSSRDLQTLAAYLALDPAAVELLEVMHADYVTRWDAQMKALQEELGRRTTNDPNAATNHVQRHQRQTSERGAALDAAFLHDLTAALGEEAAPALKVFFLERHIARTDPQSGYGISPFDTGAQPVNFVELVRREELPKEQRERLVAAIAPQVDTLTKSLSDLYTASADLEQTMQDLILQGRQQFITTSEDGEEVTQPLSAAEQVDWSRRWIEHSRKSAALRTRRAELLNAAWTTALATLEESQREPFLMAYEERAYPGVFKDPRAALPFLRKAADLPDLTEDQKRQVQELLTRHRAEYMELCRKMMPKPTSSPQPESDVDMNAYWREQMQQVNAREKVRFDRDEQCQRAISQLRRILTEAQVTRIAGLADYEKKAAAQPEAPTIIQYTEEAE